MDFKEATVTLFGRRRAYIENYKSILEYREDCVRILGKSCRIGLAGQNLKITWYSMEDMQITGEIEHIFFEA